MKQLTVQFKDLRLFLSSGEDFASALDHWSLAVLKNPSQDRLLQLELAATVTLEKLLSRRYV